MDDEKCPAYWLRNALPGEREGWSIPCVITLALFERTGGSIDWRLLPSAAQKIDEILVHEGREGVVSYKQHRGKTFGELTSKVATFLHTPAASRAVLVIFAQDGEVAEQTLQALRDAESLEVTPFPQ